LYFTSFFKKARRKISHRWLQILQPLESDCFITSKQNVDAETLADQVHHRPFNAAMVGRLEAAGHLANLHQLLKHPICR